MWRLDELQRGLFSKIPDLPRPSTIDNLLVVLRPTLEAVAYINELQPKASVQISRSVAAGDPIFVADILDMLAFDLGVEIPSDCGFVVVRSHGWRKVLLYDLCPLGPEGPRAVGPHRPNRVVLPHDPECTDHTVDVVHDKLSAEDVAGVRAGEHGDAVAQREVGARRPHLSGQSLGARRAHRHTW